MTITEFLTARLDEDEALARIAIEDRVPKIAGASYALTMWDYITPERVLADIAAKRAIAAEHGDTHECSGPSGGMTFDPVLQEDDWGGPCNTLCHLAQPYADHPDFDPAWRV